MILPDVKYSYSDLAIVPAITSDIKSRSECNPYYQNFNNKILPIFTAPMESICNDKNYMVFEREGIIPIIHRNVPIEKRLELLDAGKWCAYSLEEFKKYFVHIDSKILIPDKTYYVLIDVANGHMQQIFDMVIEAKEIARIKKYNLILMTGNIANPNTYIKCCEAGIDYVRCSIGTGSQCLTSANTAIHYPNASLISEIYKIKQQRINDLYFTTKIIADGGMGNPEEAFSRSIIALALGADYIMIGGAFVSFIDSAAQVSSGFCDISNEKGFNLFCENDNPYLIKNTKASKLLKFGCEYTIGICNIFFVPLDKIYSNPELAQYIVDNWKQLKKKSFGMSSKQAQENNPNFNGVYKTSEGKTIVVDVKYTCNSWVSNFKAYFKSTMSYCNARTLAEFIGKQTLVIKSSGTYFSVNK